MRHFLTLLVSFCLVISTQAGPIDVAEIEEHEKKLGETLISFRGFDKSQMDAFEKAYLTSVFLIIRRSYLDFSALPESMPLDAPHLDPKSEFKEANVAKALEILKKVVYLPTLYVEKDKYGMALNTFTFDGGVLLPWNDINRSVLEFAWRITEALIYLVTHDQQLTELMAKAVSLVAEYYARQISSNLWNMKPGLMLRKMAPEPECDTLIDNCFADNVFDEISYGILEPTSGRIMKPSYIK